MRSLNPFSKVMDPKGCKVTIPIHIRTVEGSSAFRTMYGLTTSIYSPRENGVMFLQEAFKTCLFCYYPFMSQWF